MVAIQEEQLVTIVAAQEGPLVTIVAIQEEQLVTIVAVQEGLIYLNALEWQINFPDQIIVETRKICNSSYL